MVNRVWNNAVSYSSLSSAVVFCCRRLTCFPSADPPFPSVFGSSFDSFISSLVQSFKSSSHIRLGLPCDILPSSFSSNFQYLNCTVTTIDPRRTCPANGNFLSQYCCTNMILFHLPVAVLLHSKSAVHFIFNNIDSDNVYMVLHFIIFSFSLSPNKLIDWNSLNIR